MEGSTLSQCAPEELLQRIYDGDRQAEQALVNRYYRGLLFVLSRQTQDYALVNDITQDTFLIVIEKARKNEIKNPAALNAFIRQTGINTLIAFKRTEKRRKTYTNQETQYEVPSENLELSHALYSEQLLGLVTQLFNEMKVERDKEILRSYYVYEKTKDVICSELDISHTHFDRVLFRAKKRLKELVLFKVSSSNAVTKSRLFCIFILCYSFVDMLNLSLLVNFSSAQVRETKYPYHLLVRTSAPNEKLKQPDVNIGILLMAQRY